MYKQSVFILSLVRGGFIGWGDNGRILWTVAFILCNVGHFYTGKKTTNTFFIPLFREKGKFKFAICPRANNNLFMFMYIYIYCVPTLYSLTITNVKINKSSEFEKRMHKIKWDNINFLSSK